MSKNKPITVLLVEDDEQDISIIKNYINTRDDIKLVDAVMTVKDAIEDVKMHMPDAIILDLELNNGEGSGLEILEQVKTLELDVQPIIVITTNILSKTVYGYAHENGADLIFYKLKDDYSPELVINNIVLLSTGKNKNRNKNIQIKETKNEQREKILNRLDRELDLIGIGRHLVGRKYIKEAILYIFENDNNQDSAFLYITKKYKKGKSTIGRSIQTAIEHAWKRTSIEDLEKYYTAPINYNTGIPTPTQFIHYYLEKIKKEFN